MNNVMKLKLMANLIRQDIITMLSESKSGHTAGPLGMADVFTALYFNFMRIDPNKPKDPNRDFLVLSNGHICPVQYAAMANRGYFRKRELLTFRKTGSRLQGHPHRESLPGLETSSGPLGEGLGQAAGMALGLKRDGKKNRVICLTSDGEHEEGSTWEAVMFAATYNLGNLTCIIDRNKIQIDGPTEEIMPLNSLKEKYLSFGWGVIDIDGNDMEKIVEVLNISAIPREKPLVIVAHTIPGKGVSFMEKDYRWHGKPPSKEEAGKALIELEDERLRLLGLKEV